jgi:hypothetical protein
MEFGKWGEDVHTLQDQQKRIVNAKKPGMTPLSIDEESRCAVFAGSGKLPYRTTLEDCTCSDFVRRKLPCKHIYRLAIDLGLTAEKSENGMNRFAFSDTLDGLSEDAKWLLYNLTGTASADGESSPVLLVRSQAADELVMKSLCIESVGNYTVATGTSTDMFRRAIEESGISFPGELLGYRCRVKNMLAELQRMYTENPSEIEKAFVVLEISPQAAENVNTINRRFAKLFQEENPVSFTLYFTKE